MQVYIHCFQVIFAIKDKKFCLTLVYSIKTHSSYHPTYLSSTVGSALNFNRAVAGFKQKQKYRGMFETQKSRNKTSSGDISLNIRTLASPKVGQDQVSGGVSVLCWHAAPVANVLWKPLAIR